MWGLVVLFVGVGQGIVAKLRVEAAPTSLTGAVIGFVLAFALSLLGGLAELGLPLGFVGVVVSVVILTRLFMLGAWIGDMIEATTRRAA